MRVRRPILVSLLVGMVAILHAGLVHAADPRLDEADAAVQKAIALLEAAQNPGVQPAFGGHRRKAIQDLQKARAQIAKAKAFADKKAGADKGKSKSGNKNKKPSN